MTSSELDAAVQEAQDKIAPGSTSLPTAFTIKNNGVADLSISSVDLSGSNADEFNLVADCCGAATVAPAASCVIKVAFRPVTDGDKMAMLDINSGDPATPTLSASLSGTVGPAAVGTIAIHLQSQPQSALAFSFSASNGAGTFSLADDGSASNVKDLSLPAGTYAVSVAAQAGWTVTSLTCADPEMVDRSERIVTVTLAAGASASCTFVQTQRLPDVSIATTLDGPYEKAGVVTVTVAPGTTTILYVNLANAGVAADRFAVRGITNPSGHYDARFTYGSKDVTANVLAGTWYFNLAPAGKRLLIVTVTAQPDTPPTELATISVRLRSRTTTATSDLVAADISGS